MNRRNLLSTGAGSLAAAALASAFATRALAQHERRTLVLVHGAWHGAWCWSPVTERLAEMGFNVLAVDLPGHGVEALVPAGSLDQPQDLAALATAPSPLAAITLGDCRTHVTEIIQELVDAGSGPVVLVGHSLGGATLHVVAEANPDLVGRLVYLTAFAPTAKPLGACLAAPEMAASWTLPLVVGDPAVAGAVRINHLSADPALGAGSRAAFYADATDAQFAAVLDLLTPDEPAAGSRGRRKRDGRALGRDPAHLHPLHGRPGDPRGRAGPVHRRGRRADARQPLPGALAGLQPLPDHLQARRDGGAARRSGRQTWAPRAAAPRAAAAAPSLGHHARRTLRPPGAALTSP